MNKPLNKLSKKIAKDVGFRYQTETARVDALEDYTRAVINYCLAMMRSQECNVSDLAQEDYIARCQKVLEAFSK